MKLLICIIVIIRFLLTLLPSFKIDMTTWQAWTSRLIEIGPTNFYSPDYFADYFPGYLYILWILGLVFKTLFSGQIFSNEFAISLKSLTNIFDIVTAFLIYKIIFKYNKTWAKAAGLLYLANPALIFNSSVWGQVDGVLTFFLVLSLYTILELRKLWLWSIVTTLAIMIKPQALVVLPIMLIYALRNFEIKKCFIAITTIMILSIIISIPFFPQDSLLGLIKLFINTAEGYKYTSLYAFNFWAIIGWWQQDTAIWYIFSYKTWGLILFAISLIVIAYPILQSSHKNNYLIFFAVALTFLAFFLFPTRVHERYLFPFFTFFLIFTLLKRSLLSLIIYIALALIHLTNLWYVYYYYNFIYVHPEIPIPIIYSLIDNSYKGLAIITLVAFLILIFIYYRDKKIA